MLSTSAFIAEMKATVQALAEVAGNLPAETCIALQFTEQAIEFISSEAGQSLSKRALLDLTRAGEALATCNVDLAKNLITSAIRELEPNRPISQ